MSYQTAVKEKFLKVAIETPHAKVSVRENIDFSRIETHQPGFLAYAYDINGEEDNAEAVFLSIDDIYQTLYAAGYRGGLTLDATNPC